MGDYILSGRSGISKFSATVGGIPVPSSPSRKICVTRSLIPTLNCFKVNWGLTFSCNTFESIPLRDPANPLMPGGNKRVKMSWTVKKIIILRKLHYLSNLCLFTRSYLVGYEKIKMFAVCLISKVVSEPIKCFDFEFWILQDSACNVVANRIVFVKVNVFHIGSR